MTAQLLSPPSSRPTSPEPSSKLHTETAALSSRLDTRLIDYLSLLDHYTTLRAQLSKDFSSGFFALAQANRNANSTLGAGRRYGEEGYDERMKTRRTVSRKRERRFRPSDSDQREDAETHEKNHEELEAKEEPSQKQRLQKEEQSENEAEGTASGVDQQDQDSAHTYSLLPSSTPAKDPLKWYGILNPPALRTCQKHFTSAISSTIPNLLTTTSAMRYLEEEIWALRRELDIIDEYDFKNEAALQTEDSAKGDPAPALPLANLSLSAVSSKAAPAKKSSGLLSTSPSSVGLPLEPRSRILKLG